jgi:hypothetical protein
LVKPAGESIDCLYNPDSPDLTTEDRDGKEGKEGEKEDQESEEEVADGALAEAGASFYPA